MTEGKIVLYCGPMASGKTGSLVNALQIYRLRGISLVCLRPESDLRTADLSSRSGLVFHDAVYLPEHNLAALENYLREYTVIGLDEVHFFPPDIVPLIARARRNGKTILLSGLDTDFTATPFPTTLAVMGLPETEIVRFMAVCEVCKRHNATRSQRLHNGKPARRSDPIVSVEGSDRTVTYEPRCLADHVVPD